MKLNKLKNLKKIYNKYLLKMNDSLLEDRVLSLDQATPGTGPLNSNIDFKLSPRAETFLNIDNNIRSKVDNNFIPTINGQDQSSQQYINTSYVNFTGREQISPTVVEQISLKGHEEWHNLSINKARTTTNETTNYSYAGNPERETKGYNWWRYSDTPKTTTNETTNYSYAGNPDRESEGNNWWRYADTPKTTTNETTNYSYAGNPERETEGNNWWRYADSPKTTTNETTNYSYAGNPERETDGTNWWRYADSPKTTTNETTQFSYAGNPERETDGTNWWRYADNPRTTTNETTQFSYAGNAQRESDGLMNRTQYTGIEVDTTDSNGNIKKVKLATAGVTNWGQGDMTLIEDYVPGPNGSTNIRQDADDIIGWTQMTSDWDSVNASGPGTIDQALPTATYFQQVSPDFIGDIMYPPNLEMGENNRQTAGYLVENLTKNGLSIYQDHDLRNSNSCETIPSFFVDSNAQDYSGILRKPLEYTEIKPREKTQLEHGLEDVFEFNKYNFNEIKLFNTYASPDNSTYENPLLFGNNISLDSNKNPLLLGNYLGKGYTNSALCSNVIEPPILLDTDSKQSSRFTNRLPAGQKLN